jgi:hypothetical protein
MIHAKHPLPARSTSPGVFAQLDRFGFIHHRALNSWTALRAAAAAAQQRPDLVHIVEGDLCWYLAGGRCDFYFRHPRFLTDVLKPAQLDAAQAAGTLVTLDQVLAAPVPNLRYILELKAGAGDRRRAIRELVGRLQDSLRERYWIDGYSLRLLRAVKQADPRAPTSLHTRLVVGGRVLRSAPELFPLSLPRLRRLAQVDAVTLTYRRSRTRWFRPLEATLSRTCRRVTAHGKSLILAGLATPETFVLARAVGARAGYAKFPLEAVPTLF